MKPDKIAKLGIARTFQNFRLMENLTMTDNVMNIIIGKSKHLPMVSREN